MKLKKVLFVLALVGGLAVGCRQAPSQVPAATQHTVTLNWTAPPPTSTWAGCTAAAPCTYGIYRCGASAAACASTNNVAWTEVTGPATRVSGTTYADSSVTGGTVFYVAKLFQGASSSDPSNMVTAVVPPSPGAPALNGTVADLKPLAPVPGATDPVMARLDLGVVVSKQ